MCGTKSILTYHHYHQKNGAELLFLYGHIHLFRCNDRCTIYDIRLSIKQRMPLQFYFPVTILP